MKLSFYLTLALRESRRSTGRIVLFMACIAVGVAAIVIVAGISNSVTDGIRTEGRRLMAADVTIEAGRPMPEDLNTLLSRFETNGGGGIERADIREFVSIVLAPEGDASQLAELKVVEGGYPFYGDLVLDPDQSLGELLADDVVVVAPELLDRLGVVVGDELIVGGARFRIAGTVVAEPDKLSISFSLGPRLFLSPEGLSRTALLDRGARVEYRAMLKLPEGATAEDAERLEAFLDAELADPEAYRVRTFANAQPSLRRSFDRMGRYLGLVGLLSLLVGGVGVAQVARVWLTSRMDAIAILRCVGATPGNVVIVFLFQVIAMALVASVAGAAIGTALHAALPLLIGGLLPADLIRPWQPIAILWGICLGILIALIFTLPQLLALRSVPPVRVLRRDAEPVPPNWIIQGLTLALILGGVWTAATLQAESLEHGSYFAGGLVVAVVVLALAALGVSRLVRLLPRDAGGVRLRHGLAHLARPGAATVGAIVALGLGVTFVFATRVVERQLSEQLVAELPADAPSTFLLDVQSAQLSPLKELLHREGAGSIDSQPIITARFAAIDGYSVNELADETGRGNRPRPGRRSLTRELRVTYGPELPRGNEVIAGSFPADPRIANGVSLEADFAENLDVQIGSKITLDVQGVPVDLVVTSIRTIDWRTFGINFFMFAEPGPLDDAPQQHVAVAQIPTADLPRLQAAIVREFPNVTVIHIRDVMDKVLEVLTNLGLAVRVLGAFIIIAGILVLGGTIAATQARRAKEVALLKAIGMTRRDVAAVFSIEYALTGVVAAIIGVATGSLLAWAVITQIMELPWSPSIVESFLVVVFTTILAVVAGLVASARALAARPLEVLRTE